MKRLEALHRWHVTVHSASPRTVRLAFEQSGFGIDPMPGTRITLGQPCTRFTVAHTSESAMTLWLLQWSAIADCVTIQDV